ncbi:hypothetical protein GCM10009757_28030 [Streptomyces cheonanensis]|uniref:Uncharacterized protein n=1 Tax=Streptomyces cheonanensis TaxID=312720 RepID=A0ABN2V7H1_9ACTN|nr:hypothetical protein [Streptomyces harbinensis]QKV70005.1 hypothetical protein HUT13_15405 [Streptomyces harbinensis]
MIRIVTTRRLQQIEADRDAARTRTAEVQNAADRALTRHLSAQRKLTERARQAEHDTAQTLFRAELAESEVTSLRKDVAELVREIQAAENTDVPVFIVLYKQRVHSVHATEDAAYRAAETDPTDPAPAGQWQGWKPFVGHGSETGWTIRRVYVRGLLAGVHGRSSRVHGASAGGGQNG